MAGLENQIGYGQAQILSTEGFNPLRFAEEYKQKVLADKEQQRYDDAKKEQNKKELYGILGDAFNPRDFNSLLHKKLSNEVLNLAQKINNGEGQYGDIFMEARERAGILAGLSDQLNNAVGIIDKSEKQWSKYKGFDAASIRAIAEKQLENDLNAGRVDNEKNYYDEALSKYGHTIGLSGSSTFPILNFDPEEKQTPSKDIVSKDKFGRTIKGRWGVEYYPAFFDVDMGSSDDFKEPTIRLKEVESGIKSPGLDKMLSPEAYDRYKLDSLNVLKLNKRIADMYGADFDLNTPQAETLRRVLAREDVKQYYTPRPDTKTAQLVPTINNISINNGSSDRSSNWDLSGYQDVGSSGKDLTVPFSSYVFQETGGSGSIKSPAKKVVYYPNTKMFEITLPAQQGSGNVVKKIDAQTLAQDIQGSNANPDMKRYWGLIETGKYQPYSGKVVSTPIEKENKDNKQKGWGSLFGSGVNKSKKPSWAK